MAGAEGGPKTKTHNSAARWACMYLIGDARLDIHHEEDHIRSPDGLERSVHHEELVAVVHLQRQQIERPTLHCQRATRVFKTGTAILSYIQARLLCAKKSPQNRTEQNRKKKKCSTRHHTGKRQGEEEPRDQQPQVRSQDELSVKASSRNTTVQTEKEGIHAAL